MKRWVSESFVTFDLMLMFLNDRAIRPERCKLLVSLDADGAQLFHVVFQTGEDSDRAMATVAQAEAEVLDTEDAGEAVDAAEAILLEASRDEP
jgi:hypothetical protein